MDRFFKNGGELVYTVPARLDGDGTFAQVRFAEFSGKWERRYSAITRLFGERVLQM